MQTSLVSGDDMRYLVQQSPEALTTIMGQMTSLAQDITDLRNDTDERVKVMEKQPWYKKMWMTITGKNSSSKDEIQRNQDKVVGYISEAVSQLYQMNCINQQVMCSLGNRMNQVYAQVTEVYNEQLQMKAQMAEIMVVQQQTIQALGGFVTKLNDKIEGIADEQRQMQSQITEIKMIQQQTIQALGGFVEMLNEKIESVDNFHMLIIEIQQGQYKAPNKLYSLCRVLSQLDRRALEDNRKLNILREALAQSDIINDDGISIQQYLMDILSLSDDKVGVVYLELCNFRNSFPANLFAEMIETYHFLPKMEKMSKKKETIIQKILDKYDLDASADFSMSDVSESFLENKQNSLINPELLQINTSISSTENISSTITMQNEPKLAEAEKLFVNARFKQAFPIFEELANQGNGRAMYFVGEMYIQGYGVKSDRSKGEYWRNKGAVAGDPLAKLNTAYSYDHDSSIFSEIIDEVFPAVLQLAESGDSTAQSEIADIFEIYSKLKDEEKAMKWLKKSAEQGHFRSEFKLAHHILSGSDDAENNNAAEWFRRSAEKGVSESQYWLGICYEKGHGGVPKNDTEAFQWYKKAAEQEHSGAQLKVGIFYRL